MSAYSDMILAHANLVAYWPLQEVAGVVAADVKGGRDGTYSGTYTLGGIGGVGAVAPYFGAGGKVAVPDAAVFDGFGAGAFSIEAWVRRKSTAVQVVGMSKTGTYALTLSGSSGMMSATTVNNTRTAATLEMGLGWVHVVGVWNFGGYVLVYVNGRVTQSSAISTGALVNGASDLVIGSTGSGAEGWVEQVAFYNAALTATEVEQHCFAGATAIGSVRANNDTPLVAPALDFGPTLWPGSQMRANQQELQFNVFKPVTGINTDIVRH